MGVISKWITQTSELNIKQLDNNIEAILIDGEKIQKAFKLSDDVSVFTNRRIILFDKQGFTGKRTTTLNIPYHSISFFEIETDKHGREAQITLFLTGHHEPVVLLYNDGPAVDELAKVLGKWIL